MMIYVNGEAIDLARYGSFHRRRFDLTLDTVRQLGGGSLIELGGHPWAMTARLLSDPCVELVATVSAEEVSAWPDELPVETREYEIILPGEPLRHFTNYSTNIERTRLDIGRQVDLVLACEIIEHMTRAPHMLLLNANSWLKPGGRILVTTPNGAQFENPLRVRPKMPSFRYSAYSRHNYVFTLDGLTDLMRCCGFEIESAQRCSPYPRGGLARVYLALGRLPFAYPREKFTQSLHVVGRKVASLDAATRLPKVYVPDPDWERVTQDANTTQRAARQSAPAEEW